MALPNTHRSISFSLLLFLGTVVPAVAAPVPGHIIGWGDNSNGQTTPPPGLNDVIDVASAYDHSLALRANGTVVGWGSNFRDETSIPPGLTNVVAIAAGSFCAALKADGTVVVWGSQEAAVTNIPPTATNIVAIEVASNGVLALRADGSVMGWGWAGKPSMMVPLGLSGIVQISGGPNHALARKTDGSIIGWGSNDFGQASSPLGLSNVYSVEAGGLSSFAIKSDFSVLRWGSEFGSEIYEIPPGLTGVSLLEAGSRHYLALRTNGTVVAWGYNAMGQGSVPEEMNGVTAIAAGLNHNLVVTARPRLNSMTPPVNASVAQTVTFTVSATGGPLTYQWQHRGTNLPNQTSPSLALSASPETAGPYAVVVSNAHGSITAATALNLPPPVIHAQPMGRTAYRGEDVLLTVGVSGFSPFTYQWQHSGTNLPGATASNLVVARIGPSRTGKYRVVVTDITGTSVTSSEAELGVIDPRPRTVLLTPVIDTSIFNGGSKPQGTSTILSGRRGNGIIDRALLRFDLTAIPTNALVQSAQLELSVVRAPNIDPVTFQLHRLLTAWDTSATWLQAAAGTQWSAPGGAPGVDFTTNNISGVVGAGVSTFRGLFGPSSEMQADLEAWIKGPSSNAGWILICAAENVPKTARHFGATESAFPARLTITYEVPARVPELTTPGLNQGTFSFRLEPDPGWFYIVEMRERLDEGTWAVLTNIAAGAALNPISVHLPGTNQHHFFRVNRN